MKSVAVAVVAGLACLVPIARAQSWAPQLYSDNDGVVKLDWAQYEAHVIGSPHVWILEWYTQTCPACKGLSESIKKAAKQLKDEGVSETNYSTRKK
jgi:hypothetical protein